jgi:hypothetical protein
MVSYGQPRWSRLRRTPYHAAPTPPADAGRPGLSSKGLSPWAPFGAGCGSRAEIDVVFSQLSVMGRNPVCGAIPMRFSAPCEGARQQPCEKTAFRAARALVPWGRTPRP